MATEYLEELFRPWPIPKLEDDSRVRVNLMATEYLEELVVEGNTQS